MCTNGNYSTFRILDDGCNWSELKERLLENKFLIAGLVALIGFVIIGIIRVDWIKWFYIAISLTAITAAVVIRMFTRPDESQNSNIYDDSKYQQTDRNRNRNRNRNGNDNRRPDTDSLTTRIKSLEEKIDNLAKIITNNNKGEYETQIQLKDREIEKLNGELKNIKLHIRFDQIANMIQELDRYIDGLPRSIEKCKSFEESIEKSRSFRESANYLIKEQLDKYGYCFLDFDPNMEDYNKFYKLDRQPSIRDNDQIKVVKRAITIDGESALKGEVQVPEGFGIDNI